jgi:aminoglycoside/choline kinase family phosphotransferase
VFIDFQGMRLGPAVYDLASLLVDPYVGLDEGSQQNLFQYYAARRGWGGAMERLFWLAAVERLCQALGAFGRLSRLPGGAPFRRHIPSALHLLHRAATKAGHCGKLAKLVDL